MRNSKLQLFAQLALCILILSQLLYLAMDSLFPSGAIRLTTFASADLLVKPSIVSLSANQLNVRGGSSRFSGVSGGASRDQALHVVGSCWQQVRQTPLIVQSYFKFDGYRFSTLRHDEVSIQQDVLLNLSRARS